MKQQTLLPIEPSTIHELVVYRLHGFKFRQQAREAKRERENEKQRARLVLRGKRRRPAKQESFSEELPNMRAIKVTYRAVFQQLKSTAMRCSAAVNVAVVQLGNGTWISRSAETGVDFHFTPQLTTEAAKKEAESRFETMISDGWWMEATVPGIGKGSLSQRRMIEPHEVQERDGKVYWLEPNDFTHIFDPETAKLPENQKQIAALTSDSPWIAACQQVTRLRNFVSTKANVPPTCQQCLEIYQKEYARK